MPPSPPAEKTAAGFQERVSCEARGLARTIIEVTKKSPGCNEPGLQGGQLHAPPILSKAQIHIKGCPKNAGRCPKNDIPAGCPCWRSRCQKLATDRPFVQKLFVESGCRVSQRRDDFCS